MLNKPLGMCFIIADTAAQLHMGRGFLSYLCRLEGGFCPGGIMSRGDYVRFPLQPVWWWWWRCRPVLCVACLGSAREVFMSVTPTTMDDESLALTAAAGNFLVDPRPRPIVSTDHDARPERTCEVRCSNWLSWHHTVVCLSVRLSVCDAVNCGV